MTTKPTALVIDATTGHLEERELTTQEIADLKKIADEVEALKLDELAKNQARESALAKLAALGLTEAEVAAL
jgi:hypothetical protein